MFGPDLNARDVHLRELMDDPDCDQRRLQATLRRFGLVNRLISGWGAVYRRRLRPLLSSLDGPARVLDLGSGGGDVIARLAALASRDGIAVEWTGADPDPQAHEVASSRRLPHARFLCADAGALCSSGERFDVVISNHVVHHLDEEELTGFAEASRDLAVHRVLHGDIARGPLAYHLYSVGILPLAPGTFLRTDGLRSIRRSHRAEELAAALGPQWSVSTPAPFRLLAEADGRA